MGEAGRLASRAIMQVFKIQPNARKGGVPLFDARGAILARMRNRALA
jgi:hypothetical protein